MSFPDDIKLVRFNIPNVSAPGTQFVVFQNDILVWQVMNTFTASAANFVKWDFGSISQQAGANTGLMTFTGFAGGQILGELQQWQQVSNIAVPMFGLRCDKISFTCNTAADPLAHLWFTWAPM
jgi:hypothetical protein